MLRIPSDQSFPPEHIPLFTESIRAGFPSPAADYAEESLDFNDLLIRRRAATYCLRVAGDSMSGAGILPDDILVVDRSLSPANGDIVVAALNGEFTVKRFSRSRGSVVLHPENPAYRAIAIGEEEDFQVFGVVTAVVRQLQRRRTGTQGTW
jgi:DNA polymerase V